MDEAKNSKGSFHGDRDETINHIINESNEYAPKEY